MLPLRVLVHLLGFAGTGRIALPVVALWRGLLPFGVDKVLLRGNVPFHYAVVSMETNCLQARKADS